MCALNYRYLLLLLSTDISIYNLVLFHCLRVYVVIVIVWLLDLQLHVQSVSHHLSCEFESRSWRDVLDAKVCDKMCIPPRCN
jgi:hypothetical protein